MALSYRFIHTCGHLAYGLPFFHSEDIPDVSEFPDLLRRPVTIRLQLYVPCPFCSASHPAPDVKEGEGLLVILTRTFPIVWSIVRAYKMEDIDTDVDVLSMGMQRSDGRVNHWAWIPKPVGDARLESRDRVAAAALQTENGRTGSDLWTDVSTAWIQRRYQNAGEGRFAKLWSQLNAAVAGERNGR